MHLQTHAYTLQTCKQSLSFCQSVPHSNKHHYQLATSQSKVCCQATHKHKTSVWANTTMVWLYIYACNQMCSTWCLICHQIFTIMEGRGESPIHRDSLVSSKTAYACTAHTLMPLIHSAMTRGEKSFPCKSWRCCSKYPLFCSSRKSFNWRLNNSNTSSLKSIHSFHKKKPKVAER